MPDLKVLFDDSPESTTLSKSYRILPDSQIDISIIIGDVGQSAVSDIWLEGQKIEEGVLGSFKRSVDSNSMLNKTLNIYTIVADTSRDSNYTEVALHLRGGASEFSSRLHKEVAEEGESVFYEYEIFFYQ